MKAVGVDGCPDGWLAVEYRDDEFQFAEQYDQIGDLWEAQDDADVVLIDVPIGLREEDATPRPCDAAARDRLESPRSSSVFPTPIRAVLEAEDYEEAREKQEDATDGSLGAQTWGISDKIAELDDFVQEHRSEIEGTIRESHPEVCFWALNGEGATKYSKTGAPVAAFWERVEILENVDADVLTGLREAGTDLSSEATLDDLVDAFVLAVTGSKLTTDPRTLPEDEAMEFDSYLDDWPMEMVYAPPRE